MVLCGYGRRNALLSVGEARELHGKHRQSNEAEEEEESSPHVRKPSRLSLSLLLSLPPFPLPCSFPNRKERSLLLLLFFFSSSLRSAFPPLLSLVFFSSLSLSRLLSVFSRSSPSLLSYLLSFILQTLSA